MKRDLDLVRQILIEVEDKSSPSGWITPEIEGFTFEQISYHIMILGQAKLIEVENQSSSSGFDYVAKNLTWEGHEFLDATRNDTIWTKIKKTLGDKFSTIAFPLIKELAIKYGKQELGLD